MYIAAGREKIEEVRNTTFPLSPRRQRRSGLAEDAQAAKDLEDQLTRFEKKIHDLELTRTVAMQTAPQIRMIQNNDTVMVEKIQSTIVNTIPLWKNQMVLALGLENSGRAAQAESEVTDMTNQLLLKNAEKLKQTTDRDREGFRAGHRRSRDAEGDERVADPDAGRGDPDSDGGKGETSSGREGPRRSGDAAQEEASRDAPRAAGREREGGGRS